jgi:predicted Zn finger-like uncharacterized protein
MSHSLGVTCPGCRGRFNCEFGDAPPKKAKVRCPYCDLEFLPEETPPNGN